MLDFNNINFGKNLLWFIGVVEDRMDPNFLGRLRVRCFNYHTSNRLELPTEDLPWAMVMQPTNSAAQTDVGRSPTGIVEGSWVVGFFLDGDEAQQPLVIGTLGGYATKPENLNPEDASDWYVHGFKDVRDESNLEQRGYPHPPISTRRKRGDALGVEIEEDDYVERYPRTESQKKSTTPKLARGILDLNIYHDEEVSLASTYQISKKALKEPMLSKMLNENKNIPTARKSVKIDQPSSPYNAIYPFNHVWETESGHVIEYDDTPRAERIHEYHRSGTFREIHPTGKSVTQTVGEKYDFNESHSYEYVKGTKYSTYNRGYALMINSSRMAGEDYDVRVCGSSNYNLTLESGDFNIRNSTGQTGLVSSSLKFIGTNELIEAAPFKQTSVGNHLHVIDNVYDVNAKGSFDVSAGTINMSSGMNHSTSAGDNITMEAGHTVSMIAENNFFMLPFYAPKPLGIEMKARHGHIELNAQDGDTRISSRPLGGLFDSASLTVTSALPTSVATLAQFQPAPEFETHVSHPGSIIGTTHTGYVYFRALRGNIVLQTYFVGSVKLKATPLGSVEGTGGIIRFISTARNIDMFSAMDTTVTSGLGIYTTSVIGTNITAGTEVFIKAGTRFDAIAQAGATIHTTAGVVQIGDYAAVEPAIKGVTFMQTFLAHTHLTPLGPTTPVDLITNPSLSTFIMNSYCQKTFVF